MNSLKTKNKKIHNLLLKHTSAKQDQDNYSVPIINLTDHNLTAAEKSNLKFGLHHSSVDKNKHIKTNLATEFESLVHEVGDAVPNEKVENFHHFLRVSANLFSRNIYNTTDETWRSLQGLAKNPNIAVLGGDKDSTVVILPGKSTHIN